MEFTGSASHTLISVPHRAKSVSFLISSATVLRNCENKVSAKWSLNLPVQFDPYYSYSQVLLFLHSRLLFDMDVKVLFFFFLKAVQVFREYS